MKFFATSDIKEIDRLTMAYEPISSINLMRRASQCVAEEILRMVELGTPVEVFAGNGNNGGDAVFVTYFLSLAGVSVRLWHCNGGGRISDDCAEAMQLLRSKFPDRIFEITSVSEIADFQENALVVDGLFGSGLNRPLSGFYADVVEHINSSGCKVVSIDIPSGMMGEDNSQNDISHIVKAQTTFTFQFPKLAFLLPENESCTGEWKVLDIGLSARAVDEVSSKFIYLEESYVKSLLKPRATFSHKGTYGHAMIVGGSRGKMGAVVLASRACLRSGAGLLTTFVPRCGYEIMQISVPEAMTIDDVSENVIATCPDVEKYDAVGVGIGLGQEPKTVSMLSALLKRIQRPMVLDADALNILSQNRELLNIVPENSVLTPHPKEFDRLTSPSHSGYERLQKAVVFSRKYQLYVVLKGAHTAVVCPDGKCFFNSTGNPGMATAGSGDVLCGVVTSLLAQKYLPLEAALIGVYFHGKAGDMVAEKLSQSAVTASAIVENLFC